jgi:hypothetical protein
MEASPFTGGRKLVARAAAAGALGLALTAVGAILDPRRALFAYLTAFTYWVGIAVGALILLMTFHAANARWMVLIRRVLEIIPLSSALFVVLFVPIALGLGRIFPWVDTTGLAGEVRRLWEHRRPYLNVPFFLARAGLYFAVWIAVSHLLHRWSVRQDATGEARLTLRQRRLGAGALPLIALTITFAAFDWQMSLDPNIASTIFGVYTFAGSFLAAVAVLILGVLAARGQNLLGGLSENHLHSLGKLLLAFVSFWAYIAFSQYLLIWIANLPEEVPWYLLRNDTGWRPVGIFLVLFHFVLPFFILLGRDLKRRPRPLAAMAIWVLLVHWVDLYWVVMPRLHPQGPSLHWTDLTAWVGIGASALAFTVWRMRGRAPVPVRDPYLQDSLAYEPHQ